MSNKLILVGNFDKTIHTNKKGCDAFGNPIELPEGYRFLGKTEDGWDKIQKGDLHFDIYGGWVNGHGTFCNGTNYYIHEEGRWKAWARKLVTKNNTPSSEFEDKDRCPSCGSYCNIHTDLDEEDNCNDCRK